MPTYTEAEQLLDTIRYQKGKGVLDERDYQASEPLGFANLVKSYLVFKERQGLASFYHIKRYMNRAAEFFGNVNVKDLKRKDFRQFLDSLVKIDKKTGKPILKKRADGVKRPIPLSDKSKHNHRIQLHDFYHDYLYDEEEILRLDQLPRFPKVEYELGFRKFTDIETRETIVGKIKKDTYKTNPKIWLGIDILCSYGRIRPKDLSRLKEGDIDLEYGFMTFWRPTKSKKNKRPKVVSIKLLDYHIEEFKRIKKDQPATDPVPFFRHPANHSRQPNQPFGKDYLYRAWKKACKEFGLDDLDLYGGTRHTSTTAIGKTLGKKQAKNYSGHDSNAAFDRYCQVGEQDDFFISQHMAKMRGTMVDFEDLKKAKK